MPNKFQSWSNEKLRLSLEKWARHERQSSVVVLEHIAEVIARKSFLDWGYSNIHDYLIKALRYSESAANRRIQAARALLNVPEIKEEISSGALNLSQIVMIQSAIRQEQRKNGKISIEQKRDLFGEVLNMNKIETEKLLDKRFSTPRVYQIEKHKHDDSVELTVRLPKDVFTKFLRIRQLHAHIVYDGNWLDILTYLADDYLKRRDPLRQKPSIQKMKDAGYESLDAQPSNPKNEKEPVNPDQTETRMDLHSKLVPKSKTLKRDGEKIPSATRKLIFQRDKVCQHKNKDGSTCGSRFLLEIDHIQPRHAGGSHSAENLRLLCRAHNQFRYSNSIRNSSSIENEL